MFPEYDVIVVGAGHAGCEAASSAANLGSKVLLITMDMTKIAQMSCNPAIGGIAKGQIVREIDAMGGFTGIVTDKSMMQFRMLNKSKGPAMWSPRAQCDRFLFTYEWRKIIESNSNIDLWQDSVTSLILKDNIVRGVHTKLNVDFKSKSVILTSGTFGNGLIHIGKTQLEGGRISEPISKGISEQLREQGLEVGRMKTGTPARLDGRTIDFSVLEEQKGDEEGGAFSFLARESYKPNHSCYITYTNLETHRILSTGFSDSPLFSGVIDGVGPRYCPSIEDKIVTFADKEKHQLFLEPEGFETNEYYINGFSSSLPLEIQLAALRSIKGLENVNIFRPGYAIEYDYYPPTQLRSNLETKKIGGLFFAGQINGTTGYEEAAGQGFMAGINAHLKVRKNSEFILKRNEAYIGVLIDDLITKGVDEPYRMFTSRAEYRILLRQDNADERLSPLAINLGLIDKDRKELFKLKLDTKKEILMSLHSTSVNPEQINGFLLKNNTTEIKQKVKLIELAKRPQISLIDLVQHLNIEVTNNINYLFESIEIEIKYSGYIDREKLLADKIIRLEEISIPNSLDYSKLKSISTEGRQKLSQINPNTIGQASRISGVSPADINALLVQMGR